MPENPTSEEQTEATSWRWWFGRPFWKYNLRFVVAYILAAISMPLIDWLAGIFGVIGGSSLGEDIYENLFLAPAPAILLLVLLGLVVMINVLYCAGPAFEYIFKPPQIDTYRKRALRILTLASNGLTLLLPALLVYDMIREPWEFHKC